MQDSKPKMELYPDHYVVYGANCSWWGYIREAKVLNSGLPVCPHCRKPLFQISASAWTEYVSSQNKVHKGYADYIIWLRTQKQCFKTLQEGLNTYRKITGRQVYMKWKKAARDGV